MAVITSMSAQPILVADLPRLSPPYPGLRPFQSDDSEYFFGREAQIREIVNRLRAERFVAIVGGSGSGKSSLVLAGAIPRLRSCAIPGADFWVPIVTSPGTDPVDNDTPLRRLARKFCAQLREPVDESRERRLEACVRLLREQMGLGKLVERYGNDVQDFDGVDGDNLDVNYLFLVDQFEELFHRSNRVKEVEEDSRHLVDRIVEHSKPKLRNTKVCVALTMRSEHLSDCARFEELPDAINRAFYLVRRLDESQIDQVIQQPALRYLRKCIATERQLIRDAASRGQQLTPVRWPDSVDFEGTLLQRLKRDASAVLDEQEHADHLPLLQHLLFWTWSAAVGRASGSPVPEAITMQDMLRALYPDGSPGDAALSEDVNVLKACLEVRCESIYDAHSDRRVPWIRIFRELAFKDPNTGSYTQQRAPMADLSNQNGLASKDDFAELKWLLNPWLQPHHYLHWDADSKTIKVAHETLIRRWGQLRKWTDESDRQFQMFVRLLDDCRIWKDSKESVHHLASGNQLLVYENSQLPAVLADPVRMVRLRQLLELDRDGKDLAGYSDRAQAFLSESIANCERIQIREAEEKERIAMTERTAALSKERMLRDRRYAMGIGCLVLMMAIGLAVMWLALSAVSDKELTVHRGYSLAAETQANVHTQIGDYQQPQYALWSSLDASQFVLDGKEKQTKTAEALNAVPVVDWFGPRLDALRNAELLAEARSIANLRNTLFGVPWTVIDRIKRVTLSSVQCDNSPQSGDTKFFPLPDVPNKGLAIEQMNDGGFTVYAASRAMDSTCDFGKILYSVPRGSGIQGVGVDRFLQNIVMSFTDSTQFYAVDWQTQQDPYLRPRGVVRQPGPFKTVLELESDRVGVAVDIAIGSISLRLFDINPSPVSTAFADNAQKLDQLISGDKGSWCAPLHGKGIMVFGGLEPRATAARNSTAAQRALCVIVKHRPDAQNQSAGYFGEVFAFSDQNAADVVEKRLPLLENIPFGPSAPVDVRVHQETGWLVFKSGGVQQEVNHWRATPLTLAAWRSEAESVKGYQNYPEYLVPELSRPAMLIQSNVKKE